MLETHQLWRVEKATCLLFKSKALADNEDIATWFECI